ncbi:4783_t:CDS:2 [Diversispora eburnea]|uniref:4783_t:CDS:1 n=1 Tax=Diversispora eburnea TaxID=1213867 RepID=A0A9N8WNS1_9GLOM|nr:4783_t:CDS:2 [Diversispora eburnea]
MHFEDIHSQSKMKNNLQYSCRVKKTLSKMLSKDELNWMSGFH